jgi:acyl-CoA dehydrogenase
MILWIFIAVLTAIIAVLAIPALRRSLVTPHIFALFKRILPAMSDTERDAL